MVRDRILFVLLFFGIGLLIFSFLLSNLSNNERLRLAIDFGIGAVHLTTVILSIFLGSTLIFREIDKKTILFVMSYPITRTQFWMGKFLGFAAILLIILTGLSLALMIVLYSLGWETHMSFFIALLGIYLELLLLLSITLMFGVLVRPVIAVGGTIGLFLAGHGMNSFIEIARKSGSAKMERVADIMMWSLPNLENMNWMNFIVYNEIVSLNLIFKSVIYSFGWILLFATMAVIIFRRRDFV